MPSESVPSESVWDYARPGAYYGGWITSNIGGPYKGEPGTQPMLRALQMARLEASSLPGTKGW